MPDNGKNRIGKLLVILGVVLGLGVLLADIVTVPSSAVASSDHSGHGGAAVAPAHSIISVVFASLGPAIVLAGLVLSRAESLRSVRTIGLMAVLTLLYSDGLLHWLAVLEHLSEPLYATFFIIGGAVQVFGAVLLVRRHERALWWVGVALTVFFLELYVLVLIVPAPFSLEPESLESLGALSKIIESAILVALGVFFGPRMVPVRLKDALVHRPSLALLFLGVLASLITNDLEAYRYWWLLSMTVFVVLSFLLIAVVAYACLAHYLRTGILVGLTWIFALMVVIGHGLSAVNYARAGLVFPLLLCAVSGGLLSASMLAYNTRILLGRLGLSIGNAFRFGRPRLTCYWKQKSRAFAGVGQERESEGTLWESPSLMTSPQFWQTKFLLANSVPQDF